MRPKSCDILAFTLCRCSSCGLQLLITVAKTAALLCIVKLCNVTDADA